MIRVKKVMIVGQNKDFISELARELKNHGMDIVNKKPDIIIALGGDGTYLYHERVHPNIPKLLIRDQNICQKCSIDRVDKAIKNLKKGKFIIREHMKLEMRYKNKKRIASNDVVIRNKELFHAMRCQVYVNKEQFNGEIIGDGVVIATPFGSMAYFYSITKKKFRKGIGIAFNNNRKRFTHLVLKDDSEVRVRIIRNPALMATDNDENVIELKEGDEVIIKKAKEKAKIIDMSAGLIDRAKYWLSCRRECL
jgi:NAD+ kinase